MLIREVSRYYFQKLVILFKFYYFAKACTFLNLWRYRLEQISIENKIYHAAELLEPLNFEDFADKFRSVQCALISAISFPTNHDQY